ncbi:hypothetical protein F4777DRAFT_533591 [Nemania sp. FL0916]|nr:hypothetical protein F4777DRAFT_533591 [Nemania sp. FL0916]
MATLLCLLTCNMLALQLAQAQPWGSRRHAHMFLALLILFFVHRPHAYLTQRQPHKHKSVSSPPREPGNFARDFATAVGFAVAAVIIGTTAICVFAHCWRPILDWARGEENRATTSTSTKRKRPRRRLRKDEEAWFCGVDRGLPMPQFDVLESETETELLPSLYMRVPDPQQYSGHGQGRTHGYGQDYGTAPTATASVVYTRNATAGSRAKSSPPGNNNSAATLPSWQDPDEVERPASVAYMLDRP